MINVNVCVAARQVDMAIGTRSFSSSHTEFLVSPRAQKTPAAAGTTRWTVLWNVADRHRHFGNKTIQDQE